MRSAMPKIGPVSTTNVQTGLACAITVRPASVVARSGWAALAGTLVAAGRSKRLKVGTAGPEAGVGQKADQMVSVAGTALVGAVAAGAGVAAAVAINARLSFEDADRAATAS
jgi:hypothetical protein